MTFHKEEMQVHKPIASPRTLPPPGHFGYFVEEVDNLLTRINNAGSLQYFLNAASIYVASIVQTGTNDPVVTEIFNTTGETVTAARTGPGVYTLTFSGNIWTAARSTVLIGGGANTDLASVEKGHVSAANVITLLTGSDATTPADAELDGTIVVAIEF